MSEQETTGARFVSPNELLAAAQEQMLEGREPETTEDRFRILNFVAVNVPKELAESILVLFTRIYAWSDVTDEDCANIAAFQAAQS